MKHFRNIVDRLVAPRLVFFWAFWVLSLPNLSLSFTDDMPLAARMANIFLPMGTYTFILSMYRRPGVMTWCIFPLVFLSAFQMVLLELYGHSPIAVDMFLNLVTTNVNEAGELLDNMLPGIVFVIVAYVPMLVLAAISAWKGQKMSRQFTKIVRHISALFGVAGMFSLLSAGDGHGILNALYPANVFHNIFLAAKRTYATEHYADTSRGFSFNARSTRNPDEREVYVLVIGETARAANFGIYGYRRDTNPRLASMHHLFVFGKALTQSNTTHKSVPMLLSSVSAENYDSIYHQKGIITAFKEAGFHTVFLSNQLPNRSFIDFFGQEADEWKFVKEETYKIARQGKKAFQEAYDGDLLPYIDKVLRRKRQKQLIVLHTYGSHFEYRKRYPRKMSYFRPDNAAEARSSNRVSLLNAYDNSIRYTDRLLTDIMQRLETENATSALLYTSDHGENIFDDKRHLFLHASPIPSYFELHVPFIIWLSNRYVSSFPDKAAVLSRHQDKDITTSVSVFHTMLDMAGILTHYFDAHHSVANIQYEKPASWLYLNDHNEAVPLNSIVTDEEDWQRFRKSGL